MSAHNFKNILVKGDPITKEAVAAGAITPGDLLNPESATGTLVVHSTAGGDALPRFAREYSEIGDGIDDNYASGDQVVYLVARPGDEIFANVAASASAITAGDPLESAADGTLRKHTALSIDTSATTTMAVASAPIVGYALESVDNSGGSAETRILIEVA